MQNSDKPSIVEEFALIGTEHRKALFEQQVMEAMRYLQLSMQPQRLPDGSSRRTTLTDIANEFGVTKETLVTWRKKWEQSGALRRATEQVTADLRQELTSMNHYIISQLSGIVDRQVEEALHGERATSRLASAKFLSELVSDKVIGITADQSDEAFTKPHLNQDPLGQVAKLSLKSVRVTQIEAQVETKEDDAIDGDFTIEKP